MITQQELDEIRSHAAKCGQEWASDALLLLAEVVRLTAELEQAQSEILRLTEAMERARQWSAAWKRAAKSNRELFQIMDEATGEWREECFVERKWAAAWKRSAKYYFKKWEELP